MDQHNSSGFNKDLDNNRYKIISKFFKGDSCLEVGASEGDMTKKLMEHFDFTYAVESDEKSWKKLFKLADNKMVALNSRLEDLHMQYTEYPKVDTVIVSNILEHINPDVINIFKTGVEIFLDELKKYGDKDTTFIFSVPNACSFNRRLGVMMGLIKGHYELDKQDIKVGHKKMYNIYSFKRLIEDNGFKIKESFTQGYKPFKNDDMIKLPEELKKYCLEMRLQAEGAEIFIIARKR